MHYRIGFYWQEVPRDIPGQSETGHPVVPLSWDKSISLSFCPFVPEQGQEQTSQDHGKILSLSHSPFVPGQ